VDSGTPAVGGSHGASVSQRPECDTQRQRDGAFRLGTASTVYARRWSGTRISGVSGTSRSTRMKSFSPASTTQRPASPRCCRASTWSTTCRRKTSSASARPPGSRSGNRPNCGRSFSAWTRAAASFWSRASRARIHSRTSGYAGILPGDRRRGDRIQAHARPCPFGGVDGRTWGQWLRRRDRQKSDIAPYSALFHISPTRRQYSPVTSILKL